MNTGPVVVGNIGSDRRAKYGVVGIDVVLTARIQALTEAGRVLISHRVKEACAGHIDTSDGRDVPLKGVSQPVRLYELIGVGAPYNLRIPEGPPPA